MTANRPSEMVMSLDNVRGFALAASSSAFIGSSFVIKKIGLKKAGDARVRAGCASLLYLFEQYIFYSAVRFWRLLITV